MTAHHQRGEEDEQGECEENDQAHCVVDALVVFFSGEAPQLVEKLLDAADVLIHGVQIL